MKLFEIAHSRAGDKGNILMLSLIPYDEKDYELLRATVTAEKVRSHFGETIQGEVIRYELPNISSFLFTCYNALSGGVTTSLALDSHGKSLSYALLQMDIG